MNTFYESNLFVFILNKFILKIKKANVMNINTYFKYMYVFI